VYQSTLSNNVLLPCDTAAAWREALGMAPAGGIGFYAPLTTPASAAAAGVEGTMVWDADYIYVCTATNTWKRVAIATW